jgi:hypothetical protein
LSTIATTAVHVVNVDRAGPVVVSGALQAPSTVEVTFDEDVVGIGPAGAVVVRRSFLAPFLALGQVSGDWSCLDAAGTASSCATGPVRTAVFTSYQPLAPGNYDVDINPEHVLDVTDLAGNPFRPGSVFVGDVPN